MAAEREFPVFEVPYELPFIAITEAAFTQLVNEQYAVLRRALAAQERLERIVLSERGLEALVSALATLIGAAVVVFDSRGEPLQQHAFRREIEPHALETLRSEVHERARRRESRAFVPSLFEGNQGLALPVASDGAPRPERNGGNDPARPGRDHVRRPEAWLVAIKDAGPLSDFDRLTLHQAVTIVALELLRGRVAGDTERRLAGDVLDAIVSGELSGSELARRLGPFGLTDRVDGDRAGARRRCADLARIARGRPVERPARGGDAGARRLGRVSWPARWWPAGPTRTCSRWATAWPRWPSASWTVRCAWASGARCRRPTRGEASTRRAARWRRSAWGCGGRRTATGRRPSSAKQPRVATYKDLGSFQLLLSLQDDEALRLFCDSILGPIEASEGPYGGELMRSLEAFIEENGQWERAAQRLYCHRHTLRYRIRRVEELTGRDLGLGPGSDRVLAGAAGAAAGGMRFLEHNTGRRS